MTGAQAIINLLAFTVFTVGTLLVWPSRYNVPAVVNVPFVITAYLIPIAIFPYAAIFSPQLVQQLTNLNALGGAAMLAGILIGARMKFGARTLARYLPQVRNERDYQILSRRLRQALLFGVLGVAFCFLWMGMVPIFAAEPFMAKFFKGQYKEKYDQISILYRLAQYAIVTFLPLGFTMALERRDLKLIALVLASVGMMALALQRGLVAEAFLLCLTVWATRSFGATLAVTIGSTLLWLIGSVIYLVLGMIEAQGDLVADLSHGTPDILDHLTFLGAFNPQTDLTYGLTFFGGLIPGNFHYNPSIFSLAITNPTGEISEISSGGFRMPPSIWGYVAFSWPGVVLVCLLSGLIFGGTTVALKGMKQESSLTNKMLMVLWFQIIATFAANFYDMYYYNVVSIAFFLVVCVIRRRKSKPGGQRGQLIDPERVLPAANAFPSPGTPNVSANVVK